MRVSGVDVGKRIIGEASCVFVSLCPCGRVPACSGVEVVGPMLCGVVGLTGETWVSPALWVRV